MDETARTDTAAAPAAAPERPGPCVWAAELLERLAESGTPADKLRCVRDAMAARWAASAHLPGDAPERHLSADEAVRALEDRHGPEHGTAVKARAFATIGHLEPPKRTPHPAELIPAPPRGVRPVAPAPVTDEPKADGKPDGKPDGGDRPGPGVVDLSAEVPTVGPKPHAPLKADAPKGKKG